MIHRNETETFILRTARQYATACGQTLVATFDDTLSGDLARLQVRQRIRKAFPDISRDAVDNLIEELLTP
jgi:hypothetical protein